MFKKYYKIIVAVIIAFLVIISVKLANDDSLIFDEVSHIPAGYSYVSQLDYRINPEHPPLIKVMAGIPLLFLDNLVYDTSLDFWNKFSGQEYEQWTAGNHFLHEAGNDIDQIAFFSRLPMILISVMLAFLLFRWGKKRGGVMVGLLALLLFVFDPNILGHSHLVTTDVGIAAGVTLAFYVFLNFLEKQSWKNVILLGVALGIVQVIKFSAVLIPPFFVILSVIFITLKLFKSNKDWFKTIWNYLLKITSAFIIMFLVVFLVYTPFTYQMPTKVLSQIAPAQINPSNGVLDEKALKFILWTNENNFTRSIGMYTQGIFQVKNRVKYGNGLYYMKQVSGKAFVSYFPVVFVIKQTLPHLFLYLLVMITLLIFTFQNVCNGFKRKTIVSLKKLREYLSNNFTEVSWVLFIVFYMYISMTGNLNIGFRHLFPMMPFVYLLTARVCSVVYDKLVNQKKLVFVKYIFGTVIILMIAETISAFPFYLSYFNQLVGGPKNGYKIVTDSNADWGQDLKRLEKYLDKHPEIDKIRIDYFGGDSPNNRLGNKVEVVGWYESKRPIEPGYYALSVNSLQGSIYDTNKSEENSYCWTLNYEPIAQVGTSILIFKVE